MRKSKRAYLFRGLTSNGPDSPDRPQITRPFNGTLTEPVDGTLTEPVSRWNLHQSDRNEPEHLDGRPNCIPQEVGMTMFVKKTAPRVVRWYKRFVERKEAQGRWYEVDNRGVH